MNLSDSPIHSAHPTGPGALGLHELLNGDAATAASMIASRPGEATPILAVEFCDGPDDEAIAAGVLILVPSWHERRVETLRHLYSVASRHRAAGIVVRGGQPAEIRTAFGTAEDAAMPLIRVDDSVTWREFEAIVERAIGEHAPGISATMLQPDYLYAIADSLAETFGGSVAIENHARTLLAYSTVPGQVIDEFRSEGVRTRQVPESDRNHAQYRHVLRATGPIRFPQYGEELPRCAIAIRGGSLQLGTIWAIDPEGADATAPLPESKRAAMIRGAQLAASHLLAVWRTTDTDAHLRESALQRLLSGTTDTDDRQRVEPGANASMRLVGLRFIGEGFAPGDVRQLLSFVERQLAARTTVTAAAVESETCFVAVAGASLEYLRDAVTATLRAAARVFTQPVQSALTEANAVGDYVGLRAEIESILSVPMSRDWVVRSSDDVRGWILAAELSQLFERRPYLRHPIIDRLGPNDRETAATLLAWFEHGGAAGAARALRVHENTVRYRMRRATERWKLRLDQPEEALSLWATLAALRAAGGAP